MDRVIEQDRVEHGRSRVAGASRSRGALPDLGSLRLDRTDRHPHVGTCAGRAELFPDQPLRDLFDEITASSLMKMDLDGTVYGKEGRFNAAGFTIHSGVYKARPDANCVMHTHTRAGAGVSVMKKGLRPISQDALHVLTTSSITSTACRRRSGGVRSAGRELPARRLRRASQSRAAVGRRRRFRPGAYAVST